MTWRNCLKYTQFLNNLSVSKIGHKKKNSLEGHEKKLFCLMLWNYENSFNIHFYIFYAEICLFPVYFSQQYRNLGDSMSGLGVVCISNLYIGNAYLILKCKTCKILVATNFTHYVLRSKRSFYILFLLFITTS